jgi:hypothetical protein
VEEDGLGCLTSNLLHTDADLAGATYDAKTRFPDGFDPDAHGLLPVR